MSGVGPTRRDSAARFPGNKQKIESFHSEEYGAVSLLTNCVFGFAGVSSKNVNGDRLGLVWISLSRIAV